jgi:serine/threonine protein kinase
MPTSNVRPRTAGHSGNADPARSPTETHDLLNYRLAERVAQEELATVYRAMHLTLERPVQVHILRRTDWISSSRFQLAARLAARLSHPNILPVVDAGHDERYGDYLVTPRLEARPLQDVLANGPLDPLLALRIFTQIGAALDYLHEQGIIHRDVQPANIMLTPQGSAYLTNFSLAAAPDTPDLSTIEEADYLTPYSAPEQTLTSGDPAPAQDLYSFGAVLYQMLTGELPPPPGVEPRSLAERDVVLAGADRVIRRLLAPQPAQRFADAAQAVAALRQTLRRQLDDSTEDMEESRWEPVAEWLENPLESAVGDLLDAEFVAKSRARADTLHRVDAIKRLLDRWSRHGFLRRPALGQFVQPEQIVSYNIYLYELRAHYETRTQPQPRQSIHMGGAVLPAGRELDVWEAPVPDLGDFVDAAPEPIVIPGSQRAISCTECNGGTQVLCKTCAGKGILERTRRVKDSDGTIRNEAFQENCPHCRGYGKQTCPRCEGTGQLLEEKVFTWSRHGMQHSNEDDLSGLHRLTVQSQMQQVFQGQVDPYEPRWHQVTPLQELLETAVRAAGPDGRIITTELVVRGVPVTEVDYQYKGKPHTLALIGFGNEVRGDSSLLDIERMVLYGVIALLALVVLVVGGALLLR